MALKISLAAGAVAAACIFGFVETATADQTGMAGMHAWEKVGRKTCFVDHTHTGSASGKPSEKAALAAAVKDWQEFTAFEYGLDWAYMKNAVGAGKSCTRQAGGWSCSVDARPCKR